MTEPTPTTALAQPQAEPAEIKKSLVADLAAAHGVEPQKFYEAVKVAAGCRGATDAHFMVLLVQAQKYGLDPLSSPPQLQLLDVGQGPQVYARHDAYRAFLQRAEEAGKVEWRKYREDWLPDPRVAPTAGKERALRRAGVLTLKLRGAPEPVEKIVWFDEWGGKGQWANRSSHMLEARAVKEAVRDYLGLMVYGEDDAAIIERDQPKPADAEVRDATPVVPIRGLSPKLPPAPAPLEEPPQETVPAAAGDESAVVGSVAQATDAAPAPAEPFDEAESRRIDAELAAEAAKKDGRLFS